MYSKRVTKANQNYPKLKKLKTPNPRPVIQNPKKNLWKFIHSNFLVLKTQKYGYFTPAKWSTSGKISQPILMCFHWLQPWVPRGLLVIQPPLSTPYFCHVCASKILQQGMLWLFYCSFSWQGTSPRQGPSDPPLSSKPLINDPPTRNRVKGCFVLL